MALIDLENQFKLKRYSTRQRLPNSPLLSLSMRYASSQESGPSEEKNFDESKPKCKSTHLEDKIQDSIMKVTAWFQNCYLGLLGKDSSVYILFAGQIDLRKIGIEAHKQIQELARIFRAGVRVKTLTEPGREDGNSFSKGKEYDINRYDVSRHWSCSLYKVSDESTGIQVSLSLRDTFIKASNEN
ncbi:hypothetical protein Anapl_05579 [Anas platyrhynchos]|uniref:Uncharacterized protein n=1 Tax=Anas platyrhynchos TaxID=8839 RepID=R0JZQ1_ANAPL|nr:hypothetical protein Anapl_05579 [Anas platyrhynchos]